MSENLPTNSTELESAEDSSLLARVECECWPRFVSYWEPKPHMLAPRSEERRAVQRRCAEDCNQES